MSPNERSNNEQARMHFDNVQKRCYECDELQGKDNGCFFNQFLSESFCLGVQIIIYGMASIKIIDSSDGEAKSIAISIGFQDIQVFHHSTGDWLTVNVSSEETSVTLPHLASSTKYLVHVVAVSSAGLGPPSDDIWHMIEPEPPGKLI